MFALNCFSQNSKYSAPDTWDLKRDKITHSIAGGLSGYFLSDLMLNSNLGYEKWECLAAPQIGSFLIFFGKEGIDLVLHGYHGFSVPDLGYSMIGSFIGSLVKLQVQNWLNNSGKKDPDLKL